MDCIQDLLCIIGTLHIVETGNENIQLALAAVAEFEDFLLVVGIAHDAGDIPGAVEEEWGEMEGNLAVAAEEEDLHFDFFGLSLK